jgi:hypothetical protein
MWRSVRASVDERTRRLPGDALIAAPIASWTHAITMRRPRSAVWPWLVQMGAGSRAGWYSYDRFDNANVPSADRIVPAWQTIEVGTLFPAMPGVTDGFHVLAFEAERFLTIGWRVSRTAVPLATWTCVLAEDPKGTRRIVRVRGSREYPFYGLPRFIGNPLVRAVHCIMQRRQLLGIATRVETQTRHATQRPQEVA